MTEADARLAHTLLAALEALSTGAVPDLAFDAPDSPDVADASPPMRELAKTLAHTLHTFADASGFITGLAKGDLNAPYPARNFLLSPYKSLHANLRHLTWQTQQIAKGDLAQQVSFMGDFSTAFNSLIEALREKRRIEVELAENQQQLSVILNGLADVAVVYLDPNLNVVWANEPMSRLTGKSLDEIRGRKCYESVYGEINPCDECTALAAAQTLAPAKSERSTPDGRTFFWRAYPLLCDDGGLRGVINMGVDVTERKKAEQLREDVERMARHDMKSPLNAVIGLPTVLADEPNLTDEQRDMLLLVRDAGWRMLGMINLSLDLFKMEQGTYTPSLEPVDLSRTVREVAAELAPLSSGRRIPVRVFIDKRPAGPKEPFHVKGEPLLCHSLFANLLKNALEASPRYEPVDVAMSRLGEDAIIEVRNAGETPVGMRARFFDKYATEGKADGNGLGTYSAQLMTQVMGGTIRLDASEPGRTAVVVVLAVDDRLP